MPRFLFVLGLTEWPEFSYNLHKNKEYKGERHEENYFGRVCCAGLGRLWSGL